MARNNLYKELARNLELRWRNLAENTLLPPEQTLATQLDVSKSTLRRALDLLTVSGQIRKINGVGIVIAQPAQTISRELIFLCHDTVFFAESARRFSEYALEQNYIVSIVPLSGDIDMQERIISSVIARNPVGVLIHAQRERNDLPAFHKFAVANIPTVYLMRLPRGIDSNVIEYSESKTFCNFVEIFYNEGARRLALFGTDHIHPDAATERETGFRQGMRKCRLKVVTAHCCLPGSSVDQREQFYALFQDSRKRPQAVCCMNDHDAAELLLQLKQRGIVSDNLRLSGYNSSRLSSYLFTSLLTIAHPGRELGEIAADLLIRQAENPHLGFQKIKMELRLIRIGK